MARRRQAPGGVAFATCAIVLAACTGTPAPTPAPTRASTPTVTQPEPVTLTVAAYVAGGPINELLAEYDAAHPGVVLDVAQYDPLSSLHPTLEDDLESGAELQDLVAYWDAGTVLAAGDRFVDLREHGLGERTAEVLPWALVDGTDAAGRLVGFPTEVAPMALCFRRDLLAAAGIAADREELATLLEADGGGWDVYFDLGRRYHAATGRAWFDTASTIWDPMARQRPAGYTTLDGAPLAEQDAELRARWQLLADAMADGLSAATWDWSDGVAVVGGSFATTPCSPSVSWRLQHFAQRAGGGPQTGWDVVDAFPGGGTDTIWRSGTAYLAVPATSAHPAETAALIDWLTRPEQQVRRYRPGSGLPSTRAAIAQVVAGAEPSAFYGGASLEEVFAARADEVSPHRPGRFDNELTMWFGTAINQLENGRLPDGDAAWAQAIGDMEIVLSGRYPYDVRPPT